MSVKQGKEDNVLHSLTSTQHMRPMYTRLLKEGISDPEQQACFRWKSVHQLGVVAVLHREIGSHVTRDLKR